MQMRLDMQNKLDLTLTEDSIIDMTKEVHRYSHLVVLSIWLLKCNKQSCVLQKICAIKAYQLASKSSNFVTKQIMFQFLQTKSSLSEQHLLNFTTSDITSCS